MTASLSRKPKKSAPKQKVKVGLSKCRGCPTGLAQLSPPSIYCIVCQEMLAKGLKKSVLFP